jgi:hypothetical protein
MASGVRSSCAAISGQLAVLAVQRVAQQQELVAALHQSLLHLSNFSYILHQIDHTLRVVLVGLPWFHKHAVIAGLSGDIHAVDHLHAKVYLLTGAHSLEIIFAPHQLRRQVQ